MEDACAPHQTTTNLDDFILKLYQINSVFIFSGTAAIGTTLSWGSSFSSCDFQLFLKNYLINLF